ncbi:MAG: GPR endopeptidase [Lachnospiraceae bacterium]|nr:GPR endopeptidase [Lachnospiraceae bacterium]
MNQVEIRTDLALEARESSAERCEKEEGVSFEENFDEATGIRVTTVRILDRDGEEAIGKPMGTYITLEAESLEMADDDCHRQVSEQLAEHLRKLVQRAMGHVVRDKETKAGEKRTCVEKDGVENQSPRSLEEERDGFNSGSSVKNSSAILTVGLGNRAVTSDSLGPRVVDELWITGHIEEASPRISGIIPGVMAQTGMESAQIVRGIVAETRPQLVIAIDALAARSVSRLGTTIQLTDTGIQPGSGVGNHRHSLTKESLGVPVIAIGVPTVVSAAAIVYDTAQSLSEVLRQSAQMKEAADWIDDQSPSERYQLIRELVEPSLGQMMVTPKDIDERVSQLSHTIAEGMNIALLGYEDSLDV